MAVDAGSAPGGIVQGHPLDRGVQDAPGGRPAWTALGRTVELGGDHGAVPPEEGFWVEEGNMGFQVRAANLGGKAGKGGALGLIGHQAAMQAALQKVDLEFIKAQKVDGFGVQGAQKQAK
jgi:hypothetical protein